MMNYLIGSLSDAALLALSAMTSAGLVAALLVFYLARRTRAQLPPPLIPAIPLALSPICIQLARGPMDIVRMFDTLGAGNAGLTPIVTTLNWDRHASMWLFLEAGLLILLCGIFQQFIYVKPSSPLTRKERLSSTWLFIGSIATVLFVALVVRLSNDVVGLISLSVDSHRIEEANLVFAGVSLEGMANIVSSSLVVLENLSALLIMFSVAMALRALAPHEASNRAMAGSWALTVLTVAWIGAATLGIHWQTQYLEALGRGQVQAGAPAAGMLPFLLADPIAQRFSVPPPPDTSIFVAPPPPPPPPPPLIDKE